MNIENYYKYDEIKEYFDDFIKYNSEDDKGWIKENIDDLHFHAFNNDYYIIGTYKATQWLSDEVFNVIKIIKEYENMLSCEVTDFSDAEKVVNMYVYIVGEHIVNEYRNSLEEEKAC